MIGDIFNLIRLDWQHGVYLQIIDHLDFDNKFKEKEKMNKHRSNLLYRQTDKNSDV